jgi:putative ABC transport system permease protein
VLIVPRNGQNTEYSANVFIGDHDYAKNAGIKDYCRRDFSKDMSTDVEEAFLINETAVNDFGFVSPEKAIGQSLHWK